MMAHVQPSDISHLLGVGFSEEQLAAICAPLAPGVIVAGAGTGKTTVMAARVVWLVATGAVAAHEVLGLTFTRKAAAELGQRIAVALESAGLRPGASDEAREVVSTYDSFAARLVGEFGLRLGLDTEPRMLAAAARHQLAARVVAAAEGPFAHLGRLTPLTLPGRMLSLDTQLQSNLVPIARVRDFNARILPRWDAAPPNRQGNTYQDVREARDATRERDELLGLVEGYQRLKQELGYVEHADLLARAVQLALEVPAVGQTLRGRFKVVLLDEYQDTSAAQVLLLASLFSGPSTELGRGFPVTAVGDPHQAIYGWRGAAATNILGFPERFTAADGSPAGRYTLRTNRRSGLGILAAGNAVAAPLGDEDAPGVALTAPQDAGPGRVEALAFNTLGEELDGLAQRVLDLASQGVDWADIAVLGRTNALVAKVYEVLRARDVPAEILGLGGLLHLPEVAPVVAMLRILDDVGANADVVTLLTGPRWRVGPADLEALGRRASELAGGGPRSMPEPHSLEQSLADAVAQRDPAHSITLMDAVTDPGRATLSREGRLRVGEFSACVAELRRHVTDPVAELVRRVVARLGLEVELLVHGDAGQLNAFMNHVTTWTTDGGDSLRGLLAWFDAEETWGDALELDPTASGDAVQLMTVHRAKGLEWEAVFLPGLCDKVFPGVTQDGIWPRRADALPAPLRGDSDGVPQLRQYNQQGLDSYRDEMKAEHLASETRLAYVAVTRAKRLLVASTHVWGQGLKTPRHASPFFEQIAKTADVVREAVITDENPDHTTDVHTAWPSVVDDERRRRLVEGAQLVGQARGLLQADDDVVDDWVWGSGVSEPGDAGLVARWDAEETAIRARVEERATRRVTVPEGLSATMVMAMEADPEKFAMDLLRRMPRPPSRSATRGSHFHAWVQQRFELTNPFEELDTAPPEELKPLIAAFEAGQFAHRQPVGVEVPFLMPWGGHVLRGRMDAVYEWDGSPYRELVVDWKTSSQAADDLQLAVYRLAWAQARGLDVSEVGAAFYYVATDELVVRDAPVTLIRDAMKAVHPVEENLR